MKTKSPKDLSLIQLFDRFDTDAKARKHLEAIIWPKGPVCPHCQNHKEKPNYALTAQSDNASAVRDGVYKCGACLKQFTVTVGTVFESSHIPLRKWLIAWYLLCSSKKGISSLQLQRILEIGSYRTALFMTHRIRHALKETNPKKLSGIIEADDHSIGGLYPHAKGGKMTNKRRVVFLVERGGEARSYPVNSVNGGNIKQVIRDNVEICSEVHTDIQAIFKYITVTHDETILNENIGGIAIRERLAQALNYVLTERFDRKHGLVWGGTRCDWGDVQAEDSPGVLLDANSHRALTVYDSTMLVIALNDYVQLPGVNAREASHWKKVCDKLKRNVRKYLWDGKNQKFIPHIYLDDGSPFPKNFDENAIYYHGGTAVAIEAGLLSREEVSGALAHMEADVQAAGAASIGLTFYPPYPKGLFKNGLATPYRYQNAGDWSWFGGRMIQQLVAYGYVAEAYRDLRPMVERVVYAGDFNEWWSRDNQPRGSRNFRGSAGVLGRAIEMLQAWAQQHKLISTGSKKVTT